MEEVQKGSSSAIKSKEKNSLLGDMDFGKDFFASWSSTNVPGDDAINFDFGAVSKGKKTKAFDFGKMDVDFSLGGDLEKISSFKIDMPDIDISSPLKRSETGERSKQGSGNRRKQQDRSAFHFDFDELDNFQLEPSFMKEGNKVSKNRDSEEASKKREDSSTPEKRDIVRASDSLDLDLSASKGMTTSENNFQLDLSFMEEANTVSKNRDSEEASKKGECEGFKPGKRDIIGASYTLDSDLSASKDMATSTTNTTEDDLGKIGFTDHTFSLDTGADDISKPASNYKSVEPAQVTLPDMKSDRHPKERVQEAIFQEERAFPKSYAPASIQDLSAKSVSGEQATQVTLSEIQVDVSSRVLKEIVGEKNDNRDLVASLKLGRSMLERQEKSMTSSYDSQRNICGDNDSITTGNKDNSGPTQDDLDSGDTSSSNTSRKSTFTESRREHQSGKVEGGVTSPNSDTSKSVEVKERENGTVRSKYFKRSAERESQIRLRQSSQTALPMIPSKSMGSKHQAERRRDVSLPKDAQGENKGVRFSDSASGEMTKSDDVPECGETVECLKGTGESLIDGLPNGNTSAGISRAGDKEKTIEYVSESKDAQDGIKEVRAKSFGEPESRRTLRGLEDIGKGVNSDCLLIGSKLVGSSRLSDEEIAKQQFIPEPEKNSEHVVALREGLSSLGLSDGSKSAASSSFRDKETAGKPVQGIEKNPKYHVPLRSLTSINQNNEPTVLNTQGHTTSRKVLSAISLKSPLNISGKETKVSVPKATRSLPDLSGLKISRALGASHHPSNAAVQKQTNSSRDLMQISELEGSVPPTISPSICGEKQSHTSPPLKRKTYEGSSLPNIKPLKRFSPSPTESRNVKELVDGTKKEVRNDVNISKSPNTDCYQLPTLDIARLVNFTDLEMPLANDSDDNAEKAKAYTKDLEDIYDMLQKTHEEAKELLVRAVVNNNHLLMLDHPIYEERICRIQKFAELLISK